MRSLRLPALVGLLLVPAAAAAQPGATPSQPPPPPGYYAPTSAPQLAPEPQQLKQGITFEANLGLGVIWAKPDGGAASESLGGLAGLSMGLGGWINPQLALTLRAAGVTHNEKVDGELAQLTTAFFGPSAQYWISDNAWLGGGLGLGVAARSVGSEAELEGGLGLDLRGGFTFSTATANTWNVSFELTSAYVEGGSLNGFGVLLGYQHL